MTDSTVLPRQGSAEVDRSGFDLMGARINPMTISELNALVGRSAANKLRCVVVSQNLHSIYMLQNDEKMQALQQFAYGRVDGMPIVWLGKLLGHRINGDHRVTWVDWIRPLMQTAARQRLRVFFLGGPPGLAERAATRLKSEEPELQLETHHGFFDAAMGAAENRAVLECINASRADVLIVGMGSPRQERWVADNLDEIEAPVVLTSGAVMEYVAGLVPTPPRWMGRMGLEWLFRLASDPRRFAYRYLIEPVYVVSYFLTSKNQSSQPSTRSYGPSDTHFPPGESK